MIGIGFRRCPKCKGYMTPYLITSGKTYYKCSSCGYDSANEVYTCTNKTDWNEQQAKNFANMLHNMTQIGGDTK